MNRLFETYRSNATVAALPRPLSWTHNFIILGQSNRAEEREFYLRMAIRERWSSRQLERQFKLAFFEHTVLSPLKAAPAVPQIHPETQSMFKDAYAVEFLALPQNHTEDDRHRGLLDRMKDSIVSSSWSLNERTHSQSHS